jgi:hypothetical protein
MSPRFMKTNANNTTRLEPSTHPADLAERVRLQLGSPEVARPFRVSAAAQETSNLASDQPEEQLCTSIDGLRNA